MKAKRYSTEFKSSIVALYNEGRSANSLANEYHLAVQTVTGWVEYDVCQVPIDELV
ncbi:transposase [Leuconostoc mesenteroides subsp. cremoris]|uniref:transposase n=1 Tax=Leuconostoc mesenteroides TaxID=1245 RepID=UPI000A09E7B5|nr:transposase [Leuconostoc mesenteroides subsp. cremoris]